MIADQEFHELSWRCGAVGLKLERHVDKNGEEFFTSTRKMTYMVSNLDEEERLHHLETMLEMNAEKPLPSYEMALEIFRNRELEHV